MLRTNVPIIAGMAESVRLEPRDDGQTHVVYRQGLAARWGLTPVLRLAWQQAASGLPRALAELRALAETL